MEICYWFYRCFSETTNEIFFLKSIQNRRNSGLVPCAGNLKFGMIVPFCSIVFDYKKYEKFRRRSRTFKHLDKCHFKRLRSKRFCQKFRKSLPYGRRCVAWKRPKVRWKGLILKFSKKKFQIFCNFFYAKSSLRFLVGCLIFTHLYSFEGSWSSTFSLIFT